MVSRVTRHLVSLWGAGGEGFIDIVQWGGAPLPPAVAWSLLDPGHCDLHQDLEPSGVCRRSTERALRCLRAGSSSIVLGLFM